MKRFLILFLVFILILPIFTLPISANVLGGSDEKNFFEKALEFFQLPTKFFNWDFLSVDANSFKLTLSSGGFNYVNSDTAINSVIASVYQIMYPIGFAVMLLTWAFGIAKSSISTSLDIKDKNSIIYSIFSLILGVGAMSIAPRLLTLLTGISQWLCTSLFNNELLTSFMTNIDNYSLNIEEIITGTSNEILFSAIVLLVVDLIFIINVLWIALLQAISPIFIALLANKGTQKIGLNFIREYFKALLVPVVTVIYFFLSLALTGGTPHIGGIIVALVLAISTLGIGGKKLDKLIN